MNRSNRIRALKSALLATLIVAAVPTADAQTTQFTFQGKLTDSGSVANGPYDFEFKLFNTATVGTGLQVGSTLTLSNITVTAGSFTVQLDFGSCAGCFPGLDRFLEIAVKPSSGPTYTTLSPRQQINSAPYALKSANATTADGLSIACVNCITSSQIASVSGSAIVGTIPLASLPSGSTSYIQNTTTQQASSNFNISGNGVVGGSLGIGTSSPDGLQISTGVSETARGVDNVRLGVNLGTPRAIFEDAASATQWELDNFAGRLRIFTPVAERFTIDSSGNVGIGTTTPSAILHVVGLQPATGGDAAQVLQIIGGKGGNSSIGGPGRGGAVLIQSGDGGNGGIVGSDGGSITLQPGEGGAGAFFPGFSGNLLLAPSGYANVGIGTTTPAARLAVRGDGTDVVVGSAGCGPPTAAIGFGTMSGCTDFALGANTNSGADSGTFINRPTGRSLHFRENNGPDQMTIAPGGVVSISTLAAGGIGLCRTGTGPYQISACSSSARRYKTNINALTVGLSLLSRLRPVTFTWKTDGMADMGLVAEEVAEAEPLLTFKNAKGEIEGVKYDHLSVVFINAFKEQQAQISRLEDQIVRYQKKTSRQQEELASLKQLVCLHYPKAATCKARRNIR